MISENQADFYSVFYIFSRHKHPLVYIAHNHFYSLSGTHFPVSPILQQCLPVRRLCVNMGKDNVGSGSSTRRDWWQNLTLEHLKVMLQENKAHKEEYSFMSLQKCPPSLPSSYAFTYMYINIYNWWYSFNTYSFILFLLLNQSINMFSVAALRTV